MISVRINAYGREVVMITNVDSDSIPFQSGNRSWQHTHKFFGQVGFFGGNSNRKFGSYYSVVTDYFDIIAFKNGGTRPSFAKLSKFAKPKIVKTDKELDEIAHRLCLTAISTIAPEDLFQLISIIYDKAKDEGRSDLQVEFKNLMRLDYVK